MIRLDARNAQSFFPRGALDELHDQVASAHRAVIERTGPGSELLGWRDLLLEPNDALIEDMISTAEEIRERADVLVCIGIGGSYLGAGAVIQALTPYFKVEAGEDHPRSTEVLFAGHQMSGAYLEELLEYLDGKSVYLNVISKSGTTLEPALAFRLLRRWLELRFEDADRRVVVTTDPDRGALNELRGKHGYKKYVIPPDVGGRFSVLTPVGLLPIAVAGIDIRSLFYGARALCDEITSADRHDALAYAAIRHVLGRNGYTTEALAVFEPRLAGIGAWWQQLFGESEGKEHKGLFPVSVEYSTDLHSLGQYMQDGQRTLIETFLMVERDGGGIAVEPEEADLDGLNYLSTIPLTEINRKAYEGTARAHTAGGVPNTTIWLDAVTPQAIGEAIYFFEHAVAVSGYLLGVNPFDQPGVEAYKREMFSLLGRPGS